MAEKTKKSARIGRRISFGVAVFLTLLVVAFLVTRSRLLSHEVTRYVNEHYLRGTPFEFSCGRISGDYFHRVVIRNPILRYHSSSASFNVFRADEILVEYDVLEVLRLRLIVENLQLRNVRLQLRTDENGQLVLPLPETKEDESLLPQVSALVDVQKFSVAGLQLRFGSGERELAVRDVNLVGSLDYYQGVGRLRIDSGSAYLSDSRRSISAMRLDIEQHGKTIMLRDFLVRLEQSLVMASGRYDGGQLNRLQLVFNPISLDELHVLGLVPEVDGEFGGNIVLDGPLDSLAVSGSLTGSGVGVSVTAMTFTGLLTPKEADIQHLSGSVFGCHGEGRFRFVFGSEDFFYTGSVANLDLTDGFIPDRGLPVTDLNGDVDLAHIKAKGTYRFTGTLRESVIDGYKTQAGSIDGLYTDGKGLEVNRLVLERDGYTASGSGSVSEPGEFDMVLTVQGKDPSYFFEHFKLPPVRAQVDLTARVAGPAENMRINLNGEVYGVEYLFAGVDTGVVQAEVRGVGGPMPSARVDISGKRGRIAGAMVEGPHLFLEADSSRVSVTQLTFARGDTLFSGAFAVTPRGEESVVRVTEVGIRTPGETWSLREPVELIADERQVRSDGIVLVSAAGEIGASGTYSERARRCDLRAWGRNVDLTMIQRGLALPFPVRGRATFTVDAHGDVDAPEIDLVADVTRGLVDSVAFDTLSVDVAYDTRSYRVRRLLIATAGDTLRADGTWDFSQSPLQMARDGMDPRARRASLAIRLAASGFALPTFQRALHQTSAIAGDFSGKVTITGTADEPRIKVAGAVSPISGGLAAGIRLPPFDIAASYERNTLTIANLATSSVLKARASGTFPLRLSLVDGVAVDTVRALALDVTIAESDLAALAPYVPGVRTLTGRIGGEVRVLGTAARPRYSGAIEISNASVRLRDFEETFDAVTARIQFVDNVVRLSSLSAKSDRKGTLFASGSMTMDGFAARSYRIDATASEFRVLSIPDFEMLQDGTLTITSVERADGRIIPSITGAVQVREAVLRWVFDDTGTPSPITMPTDAPGWVCSIDLSADNNVWIKNPDLSVEMSGDLILKRDQRGLYLRGDLTVLRGSYNVYGNKFRIIDGTLNFSTAETLRPEMYINAYTPHRDAAGIERRIYLSFAWPQDKKEPTLSLTYDDPGYYESDLWRMLGGSSIAGGLAANALERALNQQMAGVAIEVAQRPISGSRQAGDASREMTIGVGKYFWEDLYLQYRQGLAVSGEQGVELEYRMSRLFLLRSEFIRNSRRGYLGRNGQYTDEFNFDVKFRFEY